jgi:hypothetical protein
MIIKSATSLAFAAVCLVSIATLPAAHAQTAGDPGGNSVGTYGPNPGGPGLTPYSGGSPSAYPPPGTYAPQTRYVPPPPDQPAPGTTQVLTNGPQTNPGDVSPSWSAQRNVAESERYDRLLETNSAFRQARIRKECGPITDPQLRQQCLDSFAQYEPAGSATGYGSSTATRGSRSNYGR